MRNALTGIRSALFASSLAALAACTSEGNRPSFGMFSGQQQPTYSLQTTPDYTDPRSGIGFRIYPATLGEAAAPTLLVGRDQNNRPLVLANNSTDPEICAFVNRAFAAYARENRTIVSPLPGGMRGTFTSVFGAQSVKADELGNQTGVALVRHPNRVTRVDYRGAAFTVTTTFLNENQRRPEIFTMDLQMGSFYNFSRLTDRLASTMGPMPPYNTSQLRGYVAETVLLTMIQDMGLASQAYKTVNRTNPSATAYNITEISQPPPGAPRIPYEQIFGAGGGVPQTQSILPGQPFAPGPAPLQPSYDPGYGMQRPSYYDPRRPGAGYGGGPNYSVFPGRNW